MVKKLTISIPDDLHKKLEGYRDRLPISLVCSNALRSAIGEMEGCFSAARKRFYLLTIEEACEVAYEKGIHWAAYEATREELAFVCEWNYHFKGTLFETLFHTNTKIHEIASDDNDYLIDLVDFIDKLGCLDDILPNDNSDENLVINDFIRGAKIVWNEIKEELLPKLLDS